MVTYIRSDLDFILAQIKISEAHADGQPLYGPGGLIPSYNISWGLRTVDGTYNNLLRPEDGASDNPFPTLLDPDYRTIMVDPDGPGGMDAMPVSYQPGVDNDGPGEADPSDVFDPYVRTISNLIVDQTLGNPSAILTALQRAGIVAPANEMTVLGTITAAYEAIEAEFLAVSQTRVAYFNAATTAAANPSDPGLQQAAADALAAFNDATAALDAVRGPLDALLEVNGIVMEGDNVQITNVAPDEGLSAPFNSWFTLFGQFFDHGLDLVAKGGAGTVFIPLMPDDPLYVPGGDTNFMVLTRATQGPNGPINNTTSFVDQNQTYASHASHQVFLREYEFNAAGDPVNTGRLIEGTNSGMATWADMKAQASEKLGIWLRDQDVGNIPLLATDEYGNFIPGPNGFPQVVFPGANPGDPPVLIEGNPTANGGLGISVEFAVKTGHAFLADIAHSAVPDGLEDGDIEIGLGNGDGSATDGFYDNELLDAHFMAGDGRANENIGLTAVHHVFHSEHNRLVQHTKEVVIADAQAMLAGGATEAEAVAFLNEWLVDDVASVPAGPVGLIWDGERLFQAAKFGTEMQYQHLVFEEFARKIQPAINAFLVPDGYDVTIDPSIVAEFAHVVYRFGHSMLTESIDRYDPTMAEDHISLIEGFLNPLQFQNNGGATTVDADIAAGAIVRGMTRQAGNQIDEFVTSALRNNLLGLPLDLATINLARGRDTGVPSLNEARREFYEASQQNILLKPYESWVDFAGHLKNEASIINFIAAYGDHALITSQTTLDGKRDAALTIITGVSVGGLTVPADRLAFLNATGPYDGAVPGSLGGLESVDLWIGGLAEETMPFGGMLGSTFNFVFEIQMEKLQSGDRFYYLQRLDGLHLFGEMENNSFAAMIMRNTDATHLPSDVFSTPGLILEVDQTKQFNDLDGDGLLESADPVGSGILSQLVVRSSPDNLRYNGDEHVVLGGTAANNVLIAGIGDDTLYGDAGNDRLDGGFGNDILNGGDGDDIIVDAGGDDNIKAGNGNDVVHAGPGLDLVMGGAGQDFIFLGTDEGSEVFAGEGNDFIFGNRNAERILGNEGNDWIETGTFDGAPGDNFDEIFAHDNIDGHDVFLGDGGFDEFIGEGGDDIMVGSTGRGKMVGMSGFDWATYKDSAIGSTGVNADLSIPIIFDEAPTFPANAALDEYQSMEGLSGSAGNDILRGSNILADERLPFHPVNNPTPLEGYQGSALDAEGIALINGLQDLLGAGVTSFSAGDIILGGDGNDTITGQMGDDIIDGDKWLDVQIGVFAAEDTNHTGPAVSLHSSMNSLAAAMFAGTINPGQLGIVRTIRTADGTGDTDVAVFSDIRANYTITLNSDGSITVAHVTVTDGLESDGSDTLHNIERLRFADMEIGRPTPPTDIQWNGVVPGQNALPGANQVIATLSTVDADTTTGFVYALGAGSSPNFAVSAAGVVTRTGSAMAANTTYTLNISSTDTTGATFTETFNIRTNGGGGTNLVSFATANDDIVYGVGGNDTLAGAGGNDTLFGQGGSDTASYAGAAGGVTVSLAITSQQNTIAAGLDTLVDIENLTGSAFDDTLTGSTGDNVLSGGAGNDTYRIGLAPGDEDTINEASGTADRIAILTAGAALASLSVLDENTATTNGHLVINVNGQTITAVDHFDAGNTESIELINFDGGSFAGYALGSGDYIVNAEDPVNSGTPLARTVSVAAGNNLLAGENAASRMNGGTGSDLIFGNGGADFLNGNGGNDLLVGGSGGDTINGGDGDDVIVVDINGDPNDNDQIAGGANTDTLAIIDSGGDGETLTVAFNGSRITQIEGAGSIAADVERVTADLGAGTDTLAYTAPGGVTVNLASGTASGFFSITGIENVTGNGGSDTLTGDANANVLSGGGAVDILNGGAGGDTLIGGAGADTINTGADNDNLADVIRFSATNEFGDTVSNFDTTGTAAQVDQVQFSGTLNTAYDDGNANDTFLFVQGTSGGATTAATVGQGNANAEALLLVNGVASANLGDATAVSAAFNAEFVITSANTEDALLVVDASDGTNFSVWQWIQAANGETAAGELTLIGMFQANATVTTNNFDLV